MSAVIDNVTSVLRADSRPLLLALILHGFLLLALLTTKIPQPAQAPMPEAIKTYLYQPLPSAPADIAPAPAAEVSAEPVHAVAKPANTAAPIAQTPASQTQDGTAPEPESPLNAMPNVAAPAATSAGQSLAQRALNKAATANPAAIQQAAAASYQQLLQAQQQPKITVEKRHQQLSQDPAGQVIAKLDDGRQIVRTKTGCRLVDPGLHGFDALMAAKSIPCGDEIDNSALLQQALEKRVKR